MLFARGSALRIARLCEHFRGRWNEDWSLGVGSRVLGILLEFDKHETNFNMILMTFSIGELDRGCQSLSSSSSALSVREY